MQAQFAASTTALQSQISVLKQANDDLSLNLSFYVAGAATSSMPITVQGTLEMGNAKMPYVLVTPRGGKIFVAATTDPKILAQFKPLVGSVAQLMGTYVSGSDQMTVTSVTASGMMPVGTAATTTATTTAAASSSSAQ